MICTYTLKYVNGITTSIDRRGCRLNIKKNGLNFVEACLCVLVILVLSCQLTEPDLKCLVCSGNLLYVCKIQQVHISIPGFGS